MDENKNNRLQEMALKVLRDNDLGENTKPSPRLYPHQWLWDSCFIAIGLRHGDPERAKKEILSIFKAQWENGFLSHMVLAKHEKFRAGADKWQSARMPGSPKGIDTSCITQPPVLAEAVVRIGEKLGEEDRRDFYKQALPGIIRFHEWLYSERDPKNTGLVALIHAWESGIEDISYWSHAMEAAWPANVRAATTAQAKKSLHTERLDIIDTPPEHRPSDENYYTYYDLLDRLRGLDYSLSRVVKETSDIPVLYDVLYNAILIRANHHLQSIADEVGIELPDTLLTSISKAPEAFEALFEDGMYWTRDFRTGELMKDESAAGLVGLYTGTIPQDRADKLVEKLRTKEYWPAYGIATVPTNSPYFHPVRFWQGPVWININWLLMSGLKTYRHGEIALELREQTLDLVSKSDDMYEYYSPLDATPAGTAHFSWTAALVLDMLHDQ